VCKDDNLVIYFLARVDDALNFDDTLVHCLCCLCSDPSVRCKPHVGHDDVGSGLYHLPCILNTEHVGCGEHIEVPCSSHALNFHLITHSGFFQIRSEDSVNQPYRSEMLDGLKAHYLQYTKVPATQQKRICSTYTREDGSLFRSG